MAVRNSTPRTRQAAAGICRERRIKVTQTHYDYRPKGVKDPYRLCRAVPWVQLKGHWLEQAGFTIDAALRVRVMPGCIVVTVEGK